MATREVAILTGLGLKPTRWRNALHKRVKVDYIAPGQCRGEPAFCPVAKKAFDDHYVYAGLEAALSLADLKG